jgi:CheY-like chemotaxis protein
MTNQAVTLILGLAVIAVVAAVLWRTATNRASGTWKVSVAKLFESELSIGAQQQRQVQDNLVRADQARNLPVGTTAAASLPTTVHVRRILWVDDHPDNNVYETLALETMGQIVTKTTSSYGAFAYLSAQSYGLLITDLGRPTDQLDGLDFVRSVRKQYPGLTIVVYTMNAQRVLTDALQTGATAVVDTPRDLLASVVGGPTGLSAS